MSSAGAGVEGPAGGGGVGGGAAFVVAEPDGQGLVLAAVSPSSYRFDEFVRVADWNPDALAPSWQGADAVGGLTDIVQRMLGDGYFNYDIATYTVAPRVYAQQAVSPDSSMPPYCVECTFIGSQLVIIEWPLLAFSGGSRFHHQAPACDQNSSCGDVAGSAMALPSRYSVTASGGLQRRTEVQVPPRLPVTVHTIAPRRRLPVAGDRPPGGGPATVPVGAIPLGPPPGRQPSQGYASRPTNDARRRAVVAVWPPTTTTASPPPGRQVRLTMSPIPVREEPAVPIPPAPSSAAATAQPVNLTLTRRVLVPAAMSRPFVIPQGQAYRTASGGTRTTAEVGAGVAGTQTQAVAFPMAGWRGAAGRSAVVPTGARRH